MSNRLKTIVLSSLGFIMLLGSVTYTSCRQRDKCKEIVCAFDGTCVEGKCYCATGYEGTQCEKLIRAKFTGPWTATESGTLSLTEKYALDMYEGGGIDSVRIQNFNNRLTEDVKAYVSDDTLYIYRQTLPYQNTTVTVEGRGYLAPSRYYQEHSDLIVHYYVTDNTTGRTNDFGWDHGKSSEWVK
jgi:hypothetical protein